MDCIQVSKKVNEKFTKEFQLRRTLISAIWAIVAMSLTVLMLSVTDNALDLTKELQSWGIAIALGGVFIALYLLGKSINISSKIKVLGWLLRESHDIEHKVRNMAGKPKEYWNDFANAAVVLNRLETCEHGEYFKEVLGYFKEADPKNRIKTYNQRKDLTAVQTLKFYEFVLDEL